MTELTVDSKVSLNRKTRNAKLHIDWLTKVLLTEAGRKPNPVSPQEQWFSICEFSICNDFIGLYYCE